MSLWASKKIEILKEHTLKDLITRSFGARVAGIHKKLRQAIQERDNQMRAIQYENLYLKVKIQGKDQEITAFQRHYVNYLENEDKNNYIVITEKRNAEFEYPHMSICRQHGYRRHKATSTLFADSHKPKTIVKHHNFWRDHRLIAVDRNYRHF